MKPLISIGLPVKNGFLNSSENKIDLSKSLNAILKQSYTNLEIIISVSNKLIRIIIFFFEMTKMN